MNILKQNRILGSKIFGFLLICSFSAIFAACGTSNSADAAGAAGAGTTKSCPANSNLNNCSLAQANHGDSDGTCITGYAGTCGYTCDNGEWAEDSNSCLAPCPANSNLNNCSLEAASHDDSNGTCITGYVGTCSYTCNNGMWTSDENMCFAQCPDTSTANIEGCILPVSDHNVSDVAGTCATGYSMGTCSYTCNNGMWEEDSNLCFALDTDNDRIADMNDLCANSSFTSNPSNDTDRDGCEDAVEDVDDDGNGLIEITTAAMLDNMRYNLMGTSYDDEQDDSPTTDAPDADEGDNSGCGGQTTGITECNGYELDNDISLAGTWDVITGNFHGTFDGQGYSISGLSISSGNTNVGFFANVSGLIRNIHLTGSTTVTSTTGAANATVGSLMGILNTGGRVFSSSSTLSTTGGTGQLDYIGGLVGYNNGGTIRNSYATGNASGGAGTGDHVGGLVGNNNGTIRNSYAIGNASGGAGTADYAGGLVGGNTGKIYNSYATGDANGDAGSLDYAGGLVGRNTGNGNASNSYRNSNATISGESTTTLGTARTMSELQAGTGTEYTDWSTNDWDFGTSSQYPALRSYNEDGSQQGALLCSQPSPQAQCP